jgi:tripartite-type tricarboxylate transporter receptor subunit TctC
MRRRESRRTRVEIHARLDLKPESFKLRNDKTFKRLTKEQHEEGEMINKKSNVLALTLAAGLLFLLPGAAPGQANFYEGKTLTVILSSDPAGTASVRLRPLMPYLRKHIPGNPTVIIEYMEGGGGRKGANHIFRSVRPDGLTVGALTGSVIALSILGESGIMYDINKFTYLGATEGVAHQVLYTRRELGLDSLEKLRAASGIRLGAQSVGHSGYIAGRVFGYLMGLKEPKFATGYTGPELDVALMQGEIDARSNLATSVLMRNPDWLEKGIMNFHAVVEVPKGRKHPSFAHLPELESFARSDVERRLLTVFRSFRTAGSPFVVPPGTPKDRVDILREALRRAFQDPDFLKEYKKIIREDFEPLTFDEVEKAIREIPRDPEVNALVKQLSGPGPLPKR